MSGRILILLILFSFRGQAQNTSFKLCFIYKGQMREIAHPDKVFYNKAANAKHSEIRIGTTEVLVKHPNSGKLLWIALNDKIKSLSLLKAGLITNIQLTGCRTKLFEERYIWIAQALHKCL